uniref:Uncharacterized protein n=1 Tax=Arundo donax TaxID=35708 RepID=A0A0A9B7U5_ARUDO
MAASGTLTRVSRTMARCL